MSRHSRVQTALCFSKAALCSQINPVLFPHKAAAFNSRIKSPKSWHWHLAKATQERAEQWDLMLHWLIWPTVQECAGPGGEKIIPTHIDNFIFIMQWYYELQFAGVVIANALLMFHSSVQWMSGRLQNYARSWYNQQHFSPFEIINSK